MEWQTPAWETPADRAKRVELFSLPGCSIVPEEGWPQTFWPHVGERIPLGAAESQPILDLFRNLEPGESARCHTPPWGLALYADALLFTVTLCYTCSNAYVYTSQGMDLRAFDPEGPNARRLQAVLARSLGLSE